MFDIEQCLRRLGTEYLDIWRMKADMEGKNTDEHVEVMIEAFQKAHKQGKARFLGISSHRRPWLQHVIETFPEVQIVSFPYTAKTTEKVNPKTDSNIEEVEAGFGADTTRSIFTAVRKRDIGVITIKPFMGGGLFESFGKDKFPVTHSGSYKEHELAKLTLQCILANPSITAVVPGLSTIYEVKNAAKASYDRSIGISAEKKHYLESVTNKRWSCLPEQYRWLNDWREV
jgi:predicted aldo/keto reductase-like oxidoreductase